MPLSLPNLDDRTYEDLLKEVTALIPRYAPDWTDHNASDPGIMLLELFSWLTEAMIYRLNRIPQSSEAVFLQILNGTLESGKPTEPIIVPDREAKAETILAVRKRWRAITQEDYETLVLELKSDGVGVARVKCIAGEDLANGLSRTGHVRVVIVPDSADPMPVPDDDLLHRVAAFLDERRLITSRVYVEGPTYVDVAIGMTVVPVTLESAELLLSSLSSALTEFFHPLKGGESGEGWPFGRNVYASEIYQLIEGIDGVDHVASLTLFEQSGSGWVDAGDRIQVGSSGLIHYREDAGIGGILFTEF